MSGGLDLDKVERRAFHKAVVNTLESIASYQERQARALEKIASTVVQPYDDDPCIHVLRRGQ